MRKPFRALALCMVVASTLTAVAPVPAGASGIYKTDGNDVAGPLDLASVRLTPISGGDRFQVRTLASFTAAQLDGDDGWIEVDFDTNADRQYESWVVVYYYKGKLYAVAGHANDAVRNLPVRRVDSRTVSFDVPHRFVAPYSYDFAALSIWRASPCSRSNPCVDAIPNKYPLLRHDFSAPLVNFIDRPLVSSDASVTLTFPVTFRVKDDKYGSGVKRWAFKVRAVGDPWVTTDSGTANLATVQVIGAEGVVYEYRVKAVDRQGNTRTVGDYVTVVPFDDRNAALVYGNGTPVQTNNVTGAFLGTTSALPSATTVTLTLSESTRMRVCVIGGPTSGVSSSVQIAVNGDYKETVSESTATILGTSLCSTRKYAGTSVQLTVSSGGEPFILDGFALV